MSVPRFLFRKGQSEVDEALDLLGREPPGEARHGAVSLGDAVADERPVPPPHHGGNQEVEVRAELQRLRIPLPLPFVTVAAGAVGRVDLGRSFRFLRAAREKRQGREQEEGAPRSQGCLRCTRVAVAWSRGRTTISSMLTWEGRVAAHTMQSAMSSATRGSRPR